MIPGASGHWLGTQTVAMAPQHNHRAFLAAAHGSMDNRFHLIIISQRNDWPDTWRKLQLTWNLDRSCWNCHTSIKLFWPQSIASWIAGFFFLVLPLRIERCLIITIFQFSYRICHLEDTGNKFGAGYAGHISDNNLWGWCQLKWWYQSNGKVCWFIIKYLLEYWLSSKIKLMEIECHQGMVTCCLLSTEPSAVARKALC